MAASIRQPGSIRSNMTMFLSDGHSTVRPTGMVGSDIGRKIVKIKKIVATGRDCPSSQFVALDPVVVPVLHRGGFRQCTT
jgi:hypothetical protein